jgi:hypothetical protein
MIATTADSPARVGSIAWSEQTNGQLTQAEHRALLRPLAHAHAQNVAGRAAMAVRMNSGRCANIPARAMRRPSSLLTRTAEEQASQRLSPALLGHAYRSFLFAVALGSVECVDVDRELLFAAAMLHDVGLALPARGVDFTLSGSRLAREVAETVGLSTAATAILRSAITLHHSPDVTLDDGPVAYLMSAGAALDATGLRAWQLPPQVRKAVITEHPRPGFKREFNRVWATEAAAVPRGRAQLLRRYGAFSLAVRLAPFSD